MEVFQVVQFEKNNTGDAACKEIFYQSPKLWKKENETLKTGKVLKRLKTKVINTSVNKQKIKHILNNIDTSVTLKDSKILKKEKNNKKTLHNRQITKQTSNKIGGKGFLRKNNDNINHNNKSENASNETVEKTAKFSRENQKQKKTQKNRSTEKNSKLSSVQQEHTNASRNISSDKKIGYKQRKREKLEAKLQETITTHSPSSKQKQPKFLREKMMERLQAARFRYINEQIYSRDSKEAQKLFSKDPESFQAYHEGYKQQVNKWPLNPVDVIIKSIQKMPKTHVIADFGCGDAKLGKSVENQVHSFDLVATNELVTPCDMAHVPLQSNSVDAAVFCLSLMGTNLHDYILEANRVLKLGGILKIAEVESRFEDVQQFIEGLRKFNFKNTWKDLSHNLFYFLDFKKESNIKNKKKLPTISLNPCLYKKR